MIGHMHRFAIIVLIYAMSLRLSFLTYAALYTT